MKVLLFVMITITNGPNISVSHSFTPMQTMAQCEKLSASLNAVKGESPKFRDVSATCMPIE
jgi:hypothetical protein